MARESLYRKYRPHAFSEVVGQERITSVLAEAVKGGKVGHAYLFAGSRGLGKTSVARILAKEVGCSEHDLYEVDAASNNSVEDIRALTEGVYTLPFDSPYKVYILDEVHMLSKAAWNAFLKTLEEPPSYVIFILATTELERVPETVQSRCQVFEFTKPGQKDIVALVTSVAKKEGFALAKDAAELIALLADGSYRDALSVLQKVLTPLEEKKGRQDTLERTMVEEVTGAPKRAQIHALVSALASRDRAAALTIIENAAKSGMNMTLFLDLTIDTLRNVLLIQFAPDLRASLEKDLGSDEFATLEKVGAGKTPGITHETLLAFLSAEEFMRYAPIPQIPLMLAVFKLFPESFEK